MASCKYWDAGWCYAPDYLKTNATQGGCFEPEYCPSQMSDLKFTSPSGETTIKVQDTGRLGTVAPKTQLHIKMDEPVKYETPMTENEEEIEKVKAEIKVLEKKVALLEEIEKQPKTLFDVIRNLGYSVDACYEIVDAVEEFQKPKEYQPTPQTHEQVADGLKEAFRTAIKEGIIPEIKQPTDELIEKLVKKPPEFLKFELGQSLTDLIYDWWEDVFGNTDDTETCIDDLVTRIEEWLPKYQSVAGSQSLGVEDMVEGFNDAIKKIKSKLRNKKDT
jgi:hypothetical protein